MKNIYLVLALPFYINAAFLLFIGLFAAYSFVFTSEVNWLLIDGWDNFGAWFFITMALMFPAIPHMT